MGADTVWMFFGDENFFRAQVGVLRPTLEVFVLAGYAVRHDKLVPLMEGVETVKKKFGLELRHPVKYNLKDGSVRAYFDERNELSLLKNALAHSDELRADLLELLSLHEARAFVCALQSLGFKKKSEYYSWAATNLLQRVGFIGDQTATEHDILICLDWPAHDVGKTYFDAYHTPWHDGKSLEGHPFLCGTLRSRRAFPDIVVGSTVHDPYLQLADLVVGASTDFLNWALTGKNQKRVDKFFPGVSDSLYKVAGYGVTQTSLICSPNSFLQKVSKAYTSFLAGPPAPTTKGP